MGVQREQDDASQSDHGKTHEETEREDDTETIDTKTDQELEQDIADHRSGQQRCRSQGIESKALGITGQIRCQRGDADHQERGQDQQIECGLFI